MTRAKSISIITLGVADLERSIKFYEKLGWECSPESDPAICTYMLADNIVLGLVPYEFLGNDAQLKVGKKPEYCGFTLAINGATEEEVNEEISKMAAMYKMEADKLKELVGERETEQMKKDMAVQKAVTFVAEAAKEA